MKLFKRKPPKWVREYPIEIDRKALEWVFNSKPASFNHPRSMTYVLCDIRKPEDIEVIREKLTDDGWRLDVFPYKEAESSVVIDATKDNYELVEQTYKRDSIYFSRLADLYGVIYDGWYVGN